MARHAPPADVDNCNRCNLPGAKWRCKECFGDRLLCTKCCKEEHAFSPFHRIQRWQGSHFVPAALWQVGIKLYLGHQGNQCPNTTIDYSNGIEFITSADLN